MHGELIALTGPGQQLADLAERHLTGLAEDAAKFDETGSYVRDNLLMLADAGVLGACAPEQFGGLGVDSLHDVLVAVSRIARGCASTAICANMHMAGVWHRAREWESAVSSTAAVEVARLSTLLTALGEGDVVIAGAASEAGTRWYEPLTELTRDADGFQLNGRKIFATNSELADTLAVTARLLDDDGHYRQAQVVLYAGQEGMTVLQDWDGFGMRGSGSNSVVFADCAVEAGQVRIGPPVGPPSDDDLRHTTAVNFPLLGAYLGIAEAAYAQVLSQPSAFLRAGRKQAALQELTRIETDLACVRGVLTRAAVSAQALVDGRSDVDAARLFADWQVAKLIVNETCPAIVDRSLRLCGGRAYGRRHPLARFTRDVRAGWFMQPLGPLDAPVYIGRVALGLDPDEENE